MAGIAGQDKLNGIFSYLNEGHRWSLAIYRTQHEFTAEAVYAEIARGADGFIVGLPGTDEALAEIATDAGVPPYCCSATTVLSGCLATLAMSDEFIGIETAAIVDKVLKGTPIAEIPAVVIPANIVSVNSDTLAALGLELPQEVLAMGEVQYLPVK